MKKIRLMLCLIVCMLTLAACGKKNDGVEYDEASLKYTVDSIMYNILEIDKDKLEEMAAMDAESTDAVSLDETLSTYYNISFVNFQAAIDNYLAAMDDLGAYEGSYASESGEPSFDDKYTITAGAKEITYVMHSKFDKHNAEIEFIFDKNLKVSSVTVNVKYSTGEILAKAGLNTILGMGTVFAVLILISLIISCFKFIPQLEAKFKKGKATAAAPEAVPAAAPEPMAETVDEVDDLELVAVVAAAIAAAEDVPQDGFVVRSIRRRKSNNW